MSSAESVRIRQVGRRSTRHAQGMMKHGVVWGDRYASTVSDLLPNLDALLEKLVGDAPALLDARALAEAAVEAETEEGLDAALDAVVVAWQQP